MLKRKTSQPKAAEKIEEKSPAQEMIVDKTAAGDTETEVKEEQTSQPKAAEWDLPLVTSEVISSSATPPVEDTRLVKVLIKYPEDYPAKKRFFQNGEVRAVSAESAEAFIQAGIATKVE